MDMRSIEAYCSLDDSSRTVWGKNLDSSLKERDTRELVLGLNSRNIEVYVNSIYSSLKNQSSSLIFIRPDFCDIDETLLYDFITGIVGNRELVACEHYSRYPSIVGLDNVEFSSKDLRSKADYDSFKKNLFSRAHHESKRISGEVSSMLFSLKNWAKLMEDIKNGENNFLINGYVLNLSCFVLKNGGA